MMSLQQRLHDTYYTDRQIGDRLLTSVAMLEMQEIISDRQPKTVHELIESVCNRLRERWGWAVPSMENWAKK